MKNWFSMKALSEIEAEISIFDEIGGWGISAKDFDQELKKLGNFQKLTINISSPGGSCMEGHHIYNLIAGIKAEKTAKIMGYACSMASVIAMACDKIVMPENTFMMIHNPWMMSGGDSEQLRKDAELLDKVKSSILSAYVQKSFKSEADLSELMNAETWLTASEAAEVFKNIEVVNALEVAANLTVGKLVNIPEDARKWVKKENSENGANTNNESNGEYERGKIDGKIEAAEFSKIEMKKLNDDLKATKDKIDRLNTALNEKQSKLDKAEALNVELTGKLERLLRGGFAFEPSEDVNDWSQALAKCGNDYVEARKRYPSAFETFMIMAKKNKKKD